MQPFSRKVWNKIIYIARVFKSAPELTSPSRKENNITSADLRNLKDLLIDAKQSIVKMTLDDE
jgi:hypothetical protein